MNKKLTIIDGIRIFHCIGCNERCELSGKTVHTSIDNIAEECIDRRVV